MRYLSLSSVQITDPFICMLTQRVSSVVLPFQWELLCDRVEGAQRSSCVRNFRITAGLEQGEFYGAVFQDSDLYKWLEAVAYSLSVNPDEQLEKTADEAIELIAKAQGDDGYINTFYTIKEPEGRWCNLMEGHEMYCAGHLFEAAVAYYEVTGKDALLRIACKFADNIDQTFGADKTRGYPGHPEIELALIRLYDATKQVRYLNLATYFIDERGGEPNLFEQECQKEGHHYIFPEMRVFGPSYFQAHVPVREQRQASGHSVRAMYLYSAMADIALREGDASLKEACAALYGNTVNRQMYITGGIGSAALGERFTTDYDLPPESAYAETCASIGLMMFSKRMLLLTDDIRCYDVWERALYNTVLAGLGQDGKHFFYVNPLSVVPAFVKANPMLGHVCTTRPEWFGVACCPPNVARTLTSLGASILMRDDSSLYVLSHIASRFSEEGLVGELEKDGNTYTLTLDAAKMDVKLRVPDGFKLTLDAPIQNGCAVIAHAGGNASYTYTLEPVVRIMHAHPALECAAGKLCVTYGARVYCLEEADNAPQLSAIRIAADAAFIAERRDWLPKDLPVLCTRGKRIIGTDALYTDVAPACEEVDLTFIPYSEWANRGEGEMCVWVTQG